MMYVPSVDFSWYYELLNSNARIRARVSARDPATNQLETLVKREIAGSEGLTRRLNVDG